MDFRQAYQRLAPRITQHEIAAKMGVSYFTIRQALLPAGSPNVRTPPPNWQAALAALARERGTELIELAEELEGGKP